MPKFIVPEKIFTGPGCLKELPGFVQPLNLHQALIVTGRAWARESGALKNILNLLSSAGLETTAIEGVPAEPSSQYIDQLRQQVKSKNADLVIGLGGGSALDAAKAAAILIHSDQSTAWHLDAQKLPDKSLPVITIPSTSGTGSEVTPVSVLTDEEKMIKQSFRSEAMMPKAAFVDPELTLACPPDLTAISGMDAFVQAVESYCSKFSTNLSDALTEKAIELISKNLVRAFRDGTDQHARQAMAEGSLMAGMALSNVRLGAVHGLAHPIGGKYKIPHGLVCAVLMPAVLEFNRSALYSGAEDKYSRLCNLLMADPVVFTQNLLADLGLPKDLRDYKIQEEDFPFFVDLTLRSGSTKANPRPVTQDDVIDLLRKVV
jgi:alcohol dehydrogenase class IV